MQDANDSDDHHPAGLIRLAVLAAALVVASTATAAEPHFVALPSPLTPLTASPPLGGGATATGEGHPHRVFSTLAVRVSVDDTGAPFALRATQRLDVRRIGDYSFTIGAPVTDVAAAPGSTGEPGLRTGAVLWQGFNPGRRILAATVELEIAAAAALPLRIEVANGRVRLVNATAVRTVAYAADGDAAQLRTYLAALRDAAARGEPPTGGGASVSSGPQQIHVTVSAPLAVDGTIGNRRIHTTLGGTGRSLNAAFPAGTVRLTVRPEPPLELLDPPPGESGRALFSTRDPRLTRVGPLTTVRHVPRQSRPCRAEQGNLRLRERQAVCAGRRTRNAGTTGPELDAPPDHRRRARRSRRGCRGDLG